MPKLLSYKTMTRLFWGLAFLMLVGSSYKSFNLSQRYGGTDLRCRMVGARLMAAQKPPYSYTWNRNEPERLLDPNYDGSYKANGNVVTPAMLWLVTPLSYFDYGTIRIGWTILQYLFLFCLLYFLYVEQSPLQPNRFRVAAVTVVLVLFFAGTDIWWANIERGQTYILYALMIGLVHHLFTQTTKAGPVLAGFVSGFFFWVRPLLAFQALAYLTTKKLGYIKGLVAGGLSGAALFIVGKQAAWADYLLAVKEYSLPPTNAGNPPPAADLPHTIEGLTNLQQYIPDFRIASIATVQSYLAGHGIMVSSLVLTASAVGLAVALAFFFYRKKLYQSMYRTALLGFLLYITAEYLLIGNRGWYNVVEWVLPVGWLLCKNGFRSARSIAALVALSQMVCFPIAFTHQEFLGEGLLWVLVCVEIFFSHTTEKTVVPDFPTEKKNA